MTSIKVPVEAMIREKVLDAASARAAKQARDLSAVARTIITAASKAANPTEDGVAHPADRSVDAPRRRIRFRMPGTEYEIIRDRIRASGKSVTAALEEGLESYARTGKLPDN